MKKCTILERNNILIANQKNQFLYFTNLPHLQLNELEKLLIYQTLLHYQWVFIGEKLPKKDV